MSKKLNALFPLSGDPITNGHLNIIERAGNWVQQLVVVVLENDSKPSNLSLSERVEIIRSCIESRDLKNVRVDAYDGLLSDYATHTGIFRIIRGIRNTDDLEYEIYLEYGHKRQNPNLEIIYFLSEPQHRTTSSSIARSILYKGGQIKDYVPLQAKKVMEERMIGQYKLIITGGIASGKSFITQKLIENFSEKGYLVHNIDFDLIVREIYHELSLGKHPNLAADIIKLFGPSVLVKGKISQKKISQVVFASKSHENTQDGEKLKSLLLLLRPYINSNYHQQLSKKRGLIFLNIPLAAESQMLYESNNNVLLITATPACQERRLMNKRGINVSEAILRIKRAGTSLMKKKIIEEILLRDKVGQLLIFNNQENGVKPSSIKRLMEKILMIFPNLNLNSADPQ